MTAKDCFNEALADIKTRWFVNHVATLYVCQSVTPEAPLPYKIQVLTWRRPDSSNYAVRYVLCGNTLFVTGDLGSAVYAWSQVISLQFLTSCDFGYFASKCEASEKGREYDEFEENYAKQQIQELLQEEDLDPKVKEIVEGQPSVFSREDLQQLAQEIYDITGDSELAGSVRDYGSIPNRRAIAYWEGLRMARIQLEAAAPGA